MRCPHSPTFWGIRQTKFQGNTSTTLLFSSSGEGGSARDSSSKKRGKGAKDPALVLNRRPTGPGASHLLFQLKLSLSFHEEREKQHRLKRNMKLFQSCSCLVLASQVPRGSGSRGGDCSAAISGGLGSWLGLPKPYLALKAG